MRIMTIMRRAFRGVAQKHSSEPDIPKNLTKRKKFAGSYSDIMNLPSGGHSTLQDASSGKLVWLMDYDALP